MSTLKLAAKHVLRNMGLMKNPSVVYSRHMALNNTYTLDPEAALIIDSAEVIGGYLDDPFRTVVKLNDGLKVPFKVGVHKAVGGDHDYPNPGDILCASLASCMESTTKMIANRFNIKLLKTVVKVSALVDVRGTLRIDLNVPVAFQSMHVEYQVEAKGLSQKELKKFFGAIKKSCVIYQTLKKAIPIKIDII